MREQIKKNIPTLKQKIGIKSIPQTAVVVEESQRRIEQDQEDADKVTKASHSPAKK